MAFSETGSQFANCIHCLKLENSLSNSEELSILTKAASIVNRGSISLSKCSQINHMFGGVWLRSPAATTAMTTNFHPDAQQASGNNKLDSTPRHEAASSWRWNCYFHRRGAADIPAHRTPLVPGASRKRFGECRLRLLHCSLSSPTQSAGSSFGLCSGHHPMNFLSQAH
jgi:hypothetical protein